MTDTYTDRYRRLTEQRAVVREQAAYRARVREFGLPALLAPYTVRPIVRIPSQRRPASPPGHDENARPAVEAGRASVVRPIGESI